MTSFFQILVAFASSSCTYANGTGSRLLWGGWVLVITSQTSTWQHSQSQVFPSPCSCGTEPLQGGLPGGVDCASLGGVMVLWRWQRAGQVYWDTSGRLHSEQWALWGEAPWDGRADLANWNTGFCPQTTPAPAVIAPSLLCRLRQLKKQQNPFSFPLLPSCLLPEEWTTWGLLMEMPRCHRCCTPAVQGRSPSGWRRPCFMTSVAMFVSFSHFANMVIATTGKKSLECAAISSRHRLSPYAQMLLLLQEPPTLPASSSVAVWNPQVPGTSLFSATWQILCSSWWDSRGRTRVSSWRGSQLLRKRRPQLLETSSKG